MLMAFVVASILCSQIFPIPLPSRGKTKLFLTRRMWQKDIVLLPKLGCKILWLPPCSLWGKPAICQATQADLWRGTGSGMQLPVNNK